MEFMKFVHWKILNRNREKLVVIINQKYFLIGKVELLYPDVEKDNV